ncbi:MAG TPA: hypothetical protein VHG28_13615 [Longimicrobiaceae bacterium]|nr:hypothetical protein [Longimicrobiaceae bacterium]
MSPAGAGGEPLRFRGGPLNVVALVPGRAPPPGPAAARLTGGVARSDAAGGAALEVEPVVLPMENRIYLQFPRSTPPGIYRGVLTLDGAEWPIVAEVEPQVFLQAAPPRLELVGRPRQRVTTECVVLNAGNAAVEIGRAHAIGVYDQGGVECAFGRAAVATLLRGERRIDRFADALAEMYGGLVRISVDAGKGPVQPGETRALRLSLTVPERLKPGHTYSGRWVLHRLRYPVRITVSGDAAGEREARE